MKKQDETPELGTVVQSRAITQREPAQPAPVALMLQKVIDGGVTPDNVAVLEQLVGLYERMENKNAEREFAQALVDLQGETSHVVATKAVDVKNGVPRYTYAPYEEIMTSVQPILTRHGFSVTFNSKIEEGRIYSICTLTHKAGHSRENQFAARFTKPPGSSDAQGDMATKSYAKRGALCDCLNISIDHDDDARMEGASILPEQAAELERRVKECGANEAAFLQFAGAKDYESISTLRYDALDEMLKRKEGK